MIYPSITAFLGSGLESLDVILILALNFDFVLSLQVHFLLDISTAIQILALISYFLLLILQTHFIDLFWTGGHT